MKNNILSRAFPSHLWNSRAVMAWLTIVVKLLLFDIIWCSSTTFTAFQYPELYLNTLLLSLILVFPEMMFGWRRTQAVLFGIIDLWLVCNLMYCRTYATAIPLPSYFLIGNLTDFTDSVLDQIRWIDILFPVTTVIGIILLFSHRPPRTTTWSERLIYLAYIGILFLLTASINLLKGGFDKSFEGFTGANKFSCTTPIYTLAGKLYHDYIKSSSPLSQADSLMVSQWIAGSPAMEALPDSIAGNNRNSVVFILCESLESWVIGKEINGEEITPNLNRYVADSTTFYSSKVLSQVADGRSIDGQLLLLGGLAPLESGAWAMDYASQTYFTLPRAMKELRGTHNYLLSVDKDVTWNQRSVARSFGIDTLLCRDSWVNNQPVGTRRKLGDRSFFAQIKSKMKNSEVWPDGEKGFLQIVTYSGHNPYRLPDSLKIADFKGDYPDRLADYMAMARFTDAAIGDLVDYIRSRSDYDNTLIVITGDHEGLSSDADILNGNPAVTALGETGKYTPLIVLNSPVNGHYDQVMGQVDVYPTLLNLLGLEDYSWHGAGRSIIYMPSPGFAVDASGKIAGDTTGIAPEVVSHALDARRASDRIIRHNLLQSK